MKPLDSNVELTGKQRASAPKIQVIARAASILRALENEEDGLSLSEIALRVGLPRSTVQRIVTALADEQLLIAASPRSRVKLGPALIRLARATKFDIGPLVRPHLEALSRELRETVDLSVVQGHSAVFVDQVPGSHRLRAVSATGERFPLHCTACGKALLAALSPERLKRVLSGSRTASRHATAVDTAALREELEQIRQQMYALDLEEHTEGISAIGTWFKDADDQAFAISIPAPTIRFSRNRDKFEAALLECRRKIIRMLHNEKN